MKVHPKPMPFVAPANDGSLSREFDCWTPDERFKTKHQDTAALAWKGGSLSMIPAEGGLVWVPLPEILLKMIWQCWQRASVSPAAQRGGITIGGTAH